MMIGLAPCLLAIPILVPYRENSTIISIRPYRIATLRTGFTYLHCSSMGCGGTKERLMAAGIIKYGPWADVLRFIRSWQLTSIYVGTIYFTFL